MKVLLCCSFLLLACATTPSARATAVQESDGRDLARCRFLGTLSGYSTVSGLMSRTGVQNAKNDVLDEAASRGATHVVWQTINIGWGSSVSANAYRCEQP